MPEKHVRKLILLRASHIVFPVNKDDVAFYGKDKWILPTFCTLRNDGKMLFKFN